jgi:sugar phosphate isomerase/epimerase
MFRLGYNTNGLAHHRVLDALELVHALGYEALSITPDVGQLDPARLDLDEVARVRGRAEELGLTLTLESGARYLLDPARKHWPNLLAPEPADRARRLELLYRHVELAAELGAGVLSVWAGAAPEGLTGDAGAQGAAHEALWERLCDGLARLLARAHDAGVELSFEPEPGMFIERPSGYVELVRRLGAAGDALGLTLDVGHCVVTGDLPVAEVIRACAPRLLVVQLDDCRRGEHVHRMFGEGELDLEGTLAALLEVGYSGVASVELARDSHRGPEAAREAMARLRAALTRRS